MRPPRSYLPSLAQSGSWKVGRAIVSTPVWWTGPLTWSGFRRTERLATFPQVPDLSTMAVLPDGRAVLPVRAFSELQLMAVQKGKDPAPLVNTTEETAAPIAACGSREVAFMMGPEPYESIAFAEPATGRWSVPSRPVRVRWIPSPAHPTAKQFISRRAAWCTTRPENLRSLR
jgi:hypothetical protein